MQNREKQQKTPQESYIEEEMHIHTLRNSTKTQNWIS